MNSLCGEAKARVWRRGPTPEIQILYLQLEFEYFTFLESKCNCLSGNIPTRLIATNTDGVSSICLVFMRKLETTAGKAVGEPASVAAQV